MSRLNLDAFKAQAETQTQELEELSGGILGACHCAICDAPRSGGEARSEKWVSLGNTIAHELGWH